MPVKPRSGQVAFMFHAGHGHLTQLLNFQECTPAELAPRAEWLALHGDRDTGDMPLARFLPTRMRYNYRYVASAYRGIAHRRDWQAVFIAGTTAGFLKMLRSYPCYLYDDFSPSRMRELAPWYDHMVKRKGIGGWAKRAVQRRIYASCRAVVPMSCWAADGFKQDFGMTDDRVHPILPGANLHRWHFVDRSGRAANAPVRILMVGGEFVRKGGPLMLEWAETTTARNWELDIVTWPGDLPAWVSEALGNPSGDQRVSGSLAPRLPRVRVHCGVRANTPEMLDLFRQADLFCLPTHADGSSIASLEAMATGLPVIAGAVGGIPELIDHGNTGYLLRRHTVAALSELIDPLVHDQSLRLRTGAAARQSCEEHFNVERQMREIFQMIDRDTGA